MPQAVGGADGLKFSEVIREYILVRAILRVAPTNPAWFILATFLAFACLAGLVLVASWTDGTLFADESYPGRGLLSHYGTASNILGVPFALLLGLYLVHCVCELISSAHMFVSQDVKDGALAALGVRLEDIRELLACRGLEHKVILVLLRVIGVYALIGERLVTGS